MYCVLGLSLGTGWPLETTSEHWALLVGYWTVLLGYWTFLLGHWAILLGHWALLLSY